MNDTISARQADRDRIAKQTAEFLAKGGTIKSETYCQETAMERAKDSLAKGVNKVHCTRKHTKGEDYETH